MARTIFTNGKIFDGTGTKASDGQVTVEDGRITAVGSGLDGDTVIDLGGRTLLPGLFDCHTHVMVSHINMFALLQTPFSMAFYEAEKNLRATLEAGITSVRDGGFERGSPGLLGVV